MVRAVSVIALLVVVPLLTEAFLFPNVGGGGGCCCGCAQPQPSTCGCQAPPPPPPPSCQPAPVVCAPPPPPCPPPPPPCPPPPPPQPCPPPSPCPQAICPAPQPVYVQSPCASAGGCSSAASYGQSYNPAYGGAVGAYSGSPSGCRTRYVVIRAPTATFNGKVKQTVIPAIQRNAAPTDEELDVAQVTPGPADNYRRARGAPTLNEPKCNSKELKELIEENIVPNDPVESKRKIHKSALAGIDNAIVDVICSDSGFTYIVSTAEHCESQKEGVICFAYKRP